jgi:hypothetical protein
VPARGGVSDRGLDQLRGEYLPRLAGNGRVLVGRLQGDFGRLLVGGQGSFTERQVFAGIGGGPNTNEGVFMAALRYYPFAP